MPSSRPPVLTPPQEFSRTVSTSEGASFAATRDPPWMFMECSAKKGGSEVMDESEGLFGRVVDKVSRPRRWARLTSTRQILDNPQLYTKPAAVGHGRAAGPPGGYPRINLDEEMRGDGGWCSC